MDYVYIYFKQLPKDLFVDDIEDGLADLLNGKGEVTGAGAGVSGGNIDMEIDGDLSVIQNIKSYLLSCGFDKETVLDINGERQFLV